VYGEKAQSPEKGEAGFVSFVQNQPSFKVSAANTRPDKQLLPDARHRCTLMPAACEWFEGLERQLSAAAPAGPSEKGREAFGKAFSDNQQCLRATAFLGFPELSGSFLSKASAFAAGNFQAKKVTTINLAFASTGSDIPKSLHGCFWLDQTLQSSIAQDLRYKNARPVKNAAASQETVACFGEDPIKWNPTTRCLGPIPNYGGEHGHWGFIDSEQGRRDFEQSLNYRVTGDLCFLDDALTRAEVIVANRVSALGNCWVAAPRWLFRFLIQRESWGWNRVTTVGPDVTGGRLQPRQLELLAKIFPKHLIDLIALGSTGATQYPVIQIIDENGSYTSYFKEFEMFMKSRGLIAGVSVH